MPISDHHFAKIQAARARTEAILHAAAGSDVDLGWLDLPERLAQEVGHRIDMAVDPRTRAIALLRALDWLAVSAPVKAIGAAFGLQAFWAEAAQSGEGNSELVRSNFALVLQNLSFAMIAIGAFEEVRQLASDLLPELEGFSLPLSAASLRVAAAEAAWRQGRPGEARALLPDRDTVRQAGAVQLGAGADGIRGATLVRRDNLALELDNLETSTIAEPRSQAEREAIVLDETIEAVRSVLLRHGADSAAIEAATARLEAFRSPAEVSGPARLERAAAMLATMEEILSPLTPGLTSSAGMLSIAASALSSKDPAVQAGGMDAVARLKCVADEAQDHDAWLSYVWIESLILERRDEEPQALAALERLVERREILISAAPTVQERAGLLSAYGDLAARLAALRLRVCQDLGGAFAAIEDGKGRWLAGSGKGETPTLQQMQHIAATQRVHYLTYAVGSDASVAVFVPSGGAPQAVEIPVGGPHLAAVARRMVEEPAFRAALTASLGEALGELTRWLPAPCEDGPVRAGDVLVVAPHGPLHAIPIHALPADDGAPLAPRLAVVRAHSAALLAHTAATGGEAPRSGLALCALAENEPRRRQRQETFGQIVAELDRWVPCRLLTGADAGFEQLLAGLEPGQAVHLFAHGDAVPGTPFTQSGLLLAHGGRRPVRGWDAFQSPHLVSPERIVATPFDGRLEGSHITLQACVSGHAEANLAGDAIGVEWSLLLSGAASALATHWHIDFDTSAAFCRSFYRLWLGEGLSRAEAWRRSAETLLNDERAAWAAFSLTGDWR